MKGIAVLRSLKDKDRHDRELLVGLEEYLFGQQKPHGAVHKSAWIVNRCAEVARCAGPVLNSKHVRAAMPLQPLMAKSEGVTIGGRDELAG